MTAILDEMARKKPAEVSAEQAAATELVRLAKERGLSLTGPDGLLKQTEAAALKCLYLVTRSLDPTRVGRTRWAIRWKPALNAFAITFADRFPAAETY
jgi:hypothetical protein